MAAAPPERRLLFICADPVGERMAGLGIRCFELARALRGSAAVTIAHGGTTAATHEGVELVPFRPHAPGAVRALIERADMVVAHPQWPLVNRWLARSRARLVIDLYCPETLETLELLAGDGALARRQMTAATLDRLHSSLRCGHRFVCASETQRDLWLGSMLALRLIAPDLYDREPALREVIDVVPFGVPAEPFEAPGAGPRELIEGIGTDDEIVLWNGGIWSWLDAASAIRAVAELTERRPRVKLVFMGVGGSSAPAARSARDARELARELGVLGSAVHLHEQWVPYAQRGAWLAQAACAVSTHADHLESRFAYRTRVLDCFWAQLPLVCTRGDDLAEQIEREHLGETVRPRDPGALAGAIERVLTRGREAYAPALRAAGARQTWPLVAAPLARWLDAPRPAQRLGEQRGAVRAPLAQRAREAAYLAGGRALLARRR